MIDVALFGAGRIGSIHAGNLAKEAGARLKYVVDPNARAAQTLAKRHGAQVGTVAQVFDDDSVGAVLICSSTDTHADVVQAAAAAGKQIFCEKPVDLELARARTCADAVKSAGVACLIGFQRRYDPTFSALKARIVKGEIGTPEMLIITSRDPGAPPIPYIRSSGGIFKDMLIHDFDIFRWILDDDAETVHANGSCLVDSLLPKPATSTLRPLRSARSAADFAKSTRAGAPLTVTTSDSRCWAAKACCRRVTMRPPKSSQALRAR
jgi:myo-inositol 2-dehydrogenase/D-chiro-inositol 1-dehydrogenase